MSNKRSLFAMAMVIVTLALVISLVSIKPGLAATNLVTNPGFETGSLGPWYASGNGSGTTVVNSNAHSGTYSTRSSGTGTGAQQDNIPVTPNTSYTLTAWAKVSKNGNSVNIGVKWFNSNGTEYYQTVTSTSYQQKTITFTTGPSNTTASVYCWKTTGSQYSYCDDFSLTENGSSATATNTSVPATATNTPVPATPTPTNTPSGTNLALNAGFETGSLSPWTNWGTVSVQASNAHSGTYAARVGTGSGAAEQVISGLKSNTTYLLTGWMKTSTTAVTGMMGAKDFGGSQVDQSSTSTTYTQLSVTFWTSPGITSAKIFCYLYTGTGYLYCDDFSLTEVGPAPTVTPTPVRTLVWSDEFNTAANTQPNPADWGYEIGYIRNNELQYYTNSVNNAYMDGNGNLVIKAIKENYQGYSYTSASINTYGKHTWQYGRIEMRAKLPYGKGIWPAFWGMGDWAVNPWPACGEIDVMEMIGGGAGYDNKAYGTAHWDNNGHQQSGGSYTLPSGNFSDAYHIFAIEWNATTITWYVDSTAYFTTNISGAAQSELRQPFDIMLNLAVGGSWPGSPDGTTVFPQYYYIDYVRIYQ